MYRMYLALSIRHYNGCDKFEFNELSLHMICKIILSGNILTTYITKRLSTMLGILVINFTISNMVVVMWYKHI